MRLLLSRKASNERQEQKASPAHLTIVNDTDALAGQAHEVLRWINPDLPMFDVRTMTEQVDRSLWARRTHSWLFGSFAVVALVLAGADLYGVISWSVAQRTREIGIAWH